MQRPAAVRTRFRPVSQRALTVPFFLGRVHLTSSLPPSLACRDHGGLRLPQPAGGAGGGQVLPARHLGAGPRPSDDQEGRREPGPPLHQQPHGPLPRACRPVSVLPACVCAAFLCLCCLPRGDASVLPACAASLDCYLVDTKLDIKQPTQPSPPPHPHPRHLSSQKLWRVAAELIPKLQTRASGSGGSGGGGNNKKRGNKKKKGRRR